MVHDSGNEAILTGYAQNLIRFKARQLRRRRDFRFDELEDLQQDLWLAILKAYRRFDSTKATLDTFIDRVVNTAVAMMVRARQRREESMAGAGMESLDDSPQQRLESVRRKSQTITSEDLHRRIGNELRDDVQHREDSEAIAHALSSMPSSQRWFCGKLMSSSTKSLSKELGISRRQVRKSTVKIRPIFEQFGFGWE